MTPAFDRFAALGTAAVVGVADPARLAAATASARREIDACDRACSRFRPDSELSALNDPARRARPFPASDWLCDALTVAVEAAEATDGLVDPTVGQCVIDLGYDRSFERLGEARAPLSLTAAHVPAWHRVRVDRGRHRVVVPAGVRLDLGATAKACCADRAATAAAAAAGCGVLVSLGGDIGLAGPAPSGGWRVRVTDRADTPPDAAVPGQTVVVSHGGLATSGTAVRRWTAGGHQHHHLIDPRSGHPATEVWRTVTVAASSCVEANTASTAAVVLGDAALGWLTERGIDARLVAVDGTVVHAGRWPTAHEDAVTAVAS